MQIRYSKTKKKINLILGIVFTLLALSFLIEGENPKLVNYFMFVLAIMYWGLYVTSKIFFEINHEAIKVFTFPKKEIFLKDILEIKYSFGKYSFSSSNNKIIVVDKSLIFEEDVQKFENFINSPQNGWVEKLRKIS